MRRKLLLAGAGALVLVFAFPILNLIFSPDNSKLLPAHGDEVPGWTSAAAVLGKKCVHCHAADAELPFYAKLPLAKGMIAKDVSAGRDAIDLPTELARAGAAPLSEAALAKIEAALASDSMPPFRYVMLHWNHRLSSGDRAALSKWIEGSRAKYFVTPGVADAFASHALQPLPEVTGLDPARVALGDKLFHDPRLSGDDTVSCASCHGLDKGGTDQQQFSTGIRDQVGGINSPTVFNAGFQFVQFWDGRATDLADQAAGPVTNPIEMGAAWPDVLAKLGQDELLAQEFAAIYADGITQANIQDSIATFEGSLVTPSRFDQYLRGDAKALSEAEIKGFEVFTDKGCAKCHVGKVLGGQSFEKMGLEQDYFAGRELTDADKGRFNVTKDEYDQRRFKVPMLRNIARTAPYFHDGATTDLGAAIAVMSKHQLEEGLSQGERAAVLAFLESLTGTFRGKSL